MTILKYFSVFLLIIFLLNGREKINAQPLYQFNQKNISGLKLEYQNYADVMPFYPLENKIDYKTLIALSTLNVGAFTAAHIYQAKAWWYLKPNRGFRIKWDPDYALLFDKEGHFIAGHFLSHYVSSIFEAANYDTESAQIYSSLTSFLYELYIEVEDGTSKGYTFAPDDAIADFLGSAYYLAQYYYPYLKNFQPRISYWPSQTILNGSNKHNVFDDYAGQKHWLSIKMKEVLPQPVAKYWPSFLMLSVGSAIKDYFTNTSNKHRELYIAFDFDPSVIPLYGKFWEFVKNTFSYVHFPMPGLRISPNVKLFGLCY